jgi:hypothetical protein
LGAPLQVQLYTVPPGEMERVGQGVQTPWVLMYWFAAHDAGGGDGDGGAGGEGCGGGGGNENGNGNGNGELAGRRGPVVGPLYHCGTQRQKSSFQKVQEDSSGQHTEGSLALALLGASMPPQGVIHTSAWGEEGGGAAACRGCH